MSIQYFYPPQPFRIWPNSNLLCKLDQDPDWIAEIKYNGWRLLIFIEDDIRLFNRYNKEIQINKSIFRQHFEHIPPGTIFDGELVHFRSTDIKNTIVIWDTPFYNGQDIRKKPLSDRKIYLDHFKVAPRTIKANSNVKVYRSQIFKSGNFRRLYVNTVDKKNNLEEGIVIKKLSSVYDFSFTRGIETKYWIKIKAIGDHAKIENV
jgi:ATP-dependent DNA ligase